MADRPYLFDNAAPTAGPLLAYLTEVLDPWTCECIDSTRVVTPGARCLDMGAGLGMVTAHLSDLVGPDGLAVAVDEDPRHAQRWLADRPNVRIEQADLRSDPLPDGPFDLILARSVLPWLPERECIVHRAAAQLRPGGVLMTIDFRPAWDECLMACAPEFDHAADLLRRYHRAFVAAMGGRGHDARWTRRALPVFRTAGLVDVITKQRSRSWDGGQAGTMLPVTTIAERADALIAADAGHEHPITAADLDELRALMHHPDTTIMGLPIWATAGRRPS